MAVGLPVFTRCMEAVLPCDTLLRIGAGYTCLAESYSITTLHLTQDIQEMERHPAHFVVSSRFPV